MTIIINSEAFILFLNLAVYACAVWFISALKIKYINALIVSIPIVILLLKVLEIDYQTYQSGSRILNFLLGPSVVSIGYLIHKNIKRIGRNLLPLLACVALGAIVNSVVLNIVFSLLKVDPLIMLSMQGKSVTTPIAVEVSRQLGGIASLTVLSVVFTGVFGSIVGLPILNTLKISNPIARGAALGASAHAIGTARAIESSELEGAVSGLVIGVMGALTAILLPYISQWGVFNI